MKSDRIPWTITCEGKVIEKSTISRKTWIEGNRLAKKYGTTIDQLVNDLLRNELRNRKEVAA